MYSVCLAAEFARSERVELRPGHYGPLRESVQKCIANYVNDPRLCEQIREMTLIFRFFVALLSYEKRIRQRIEVAIAQCLSGTPGIVGPFQYQEVRHYLRRNHEEPIPCVAPAAYRL